ncbi:adhesin [uncultured Methanobrevibacter sp.]|uniref:adhesin n=1 Tax=uncultured Methanobrevibacter sp. TaxID=253161 RepID=UPI002613AB34|nr:adhesin [uncultured Methanobrevibacter sp.]
MVIGAVAFAFIHITSDDSSNIQKTAFDSSTLNKLPETYLNYYKDGHVIKATVEGFNSSTGEEVTINGTVKWVDEGSSVRVLVETSNGTYLCGLYKNTPFADIYLKTISIETDGSVYPNLYEFKIKPMNITSLNDLNRNLSNSNYEISTGITFDSLDSTKIQEIENRILSDNKRISIKSTNELSNQIVLSKATDKNLKDGNSILGSINGVTDEITLRIYNCSQSGVDNIKNNYEVTNIRQF